MDKPLQTPAGNIVVASTANQADNKILICSSGMPDRLKLPKAFKYIERYTSPTDQMMSPVTRGIIARSRKGSKLLPAFADHNQVKLNT